MSKSLISGLKVLLADDSVTMHRAVSLALRKLSCDLLLADNGSDAERIIQEQHPDVVLLDWDLPEKSGLELCKDIKANPNTESTKVILLLSSFEKIDEAELNTIPSDARLWKPFEANVLQTMIETLIKDDQSHANFSANASGFSISTESTAPSPAPKSAFEETAPFARTPNIPRTSASTLAKTPTLPPPPSRNSAILNSQKATPQATLSKAATPSKAAAQKTRAVEATAKLSANLTAPPLPKNSPSRKPSVDDLFKAGKKNPPREDLSQELTTETFRGSGFSEEDGDDTNASELISTADLAEDIYEPETVDLSEHDRESLGQIHNTIDQARTQAMTSALHEEADIEGSDSDEELLWGDPVTEEEEPMVPIPSVREQLKSTFGGAGESTRGGSPKSLGAEEIRRIISEELEIKFRKWLKEEVESQLSRVLKELNEP